MHRCKVKYSLTLIVMYQHEYCMIIFRDEAAVGLGSCYQKYIERILA